MNLTTLLKNLSNKSVQILDNAIKQEDYCAIDLSSENPELLGVAISEPHSCQSYIDKVLKRNNAKVACGGYLEKRNLYALSYRFSEGKERNIHLGMDFWCNANTKVIVPITGKVHSFKNNSDFGNYGPTIILEHAIDSFSFYTLYGHLSLESLHNLYVGKEFTKGENLGTLGTPDINVNYAPHLHFQIIQTIGDYSGDYPGVCNKDDVNFYKSNCLDPNLLFELY